ncbi:hypothetical protein BS78_08G142400 [Paspalum vaginatum]|nr:hypothetical protein BS78_08G142400 [Paspalum vaginatum]
MSSPAAPGAAGASAPSSQPVLPDEILGEIFLRLDSAADLARASAACSAFLRVVRFLRRNRPLYRPAVVVFLESEGPPHFHHPDPQCSASAARALAEAADFTLSSLPDAGSWMIWDASGGRLLLSRPAADAARFPDLVVCDPLHRRHVRIPPVPAGLASGSGAIRLAYLTQTGVEEQVEGSSLVVVWMMMVRFKSKVTALVFSSATREWRRVDFNSWRLDFAILTACRHHPQRSLCRTSGSFSEVLILDTRKMEFSVMRVPRVRVCRQQAIVEAGEGGRLSFLTLGDGVLDLYCEAGQGDGVGAQEWQHERRIPLPGGLSYSYTFSGVGGGYLLLQAVPQDWVEPADHVPHMPEIHYFTLKLKTLLVERLCVLNKRVSFAHLYANFLPPLSLPSV